MRADYLGSGIGILALGCLGIAGVAGAQVSPHARLLETHRFDVPFTEVAALPDEVLAAALEWEGAWAQPGASRARAARGSRSDLE
ncbi:MAG: hypothetical protein QGH45_11605, partial [Myxococcota bacterium]|nr:hypothetical protein [Myxococcota bacterium]